MSESQGEIELKEFKAPSGDVYHFRYLEYGEKMDLMEQKSKGLKVKAVGKPGFRQPSGAKKQMDMDASADLDLASIIATQRETVWRTVIKASWLKEGQKVTKELCDKKIKGVDAEAINDFVDQLNWPKDMGETVEKSSGQ